MSRAVFALVSILVAAAAASGLANTTSSLAAQRVPATREEALALIGQIKAVLEGNGKDSPSLSGDRKVLVDASATIDRLLTEFDDAAARAAAGYAAIETALAQPAAPGEHSCEVMTSSADKATRTSAEVTATRRAIDDLVMDTTVPASACRVADAARLRAAAADLLHAKAKLLEGVTDWAGARQAEDQSRRTVMNYRNSIAALDAMDDIGDRLTEVARRAESSYADYERWTMSSAPRIAVIRKTAASFGIEREIAELETLAVAGSNEFAKLALVFKTPGFVGRMSAVAKARADGGKTRESLKAAAARFDCAASAGAVSAEVASELAGALYRIDDAGRSWLATADRCEKKKAYIQRVALETTFASVKVGDTINRPLLLQSSTDLLGDPTDVSARAEWTGTPVPFTPTAAQGNMIFFVTATIEGRASTLTIFVEPGRPARR